MVLYRNIEKKDLKAIARIHKEQFPNHYLGKYSISLLSKFYENLMCGNFIFLVAEENDCICGFVVGGELKPILAQINKFVKKNAFHCALEILVRPATWSESLSKAKNMLWKEHSDEYNLDDVEKYTLLSIATAKNMQGRGIGSGLVENFSKEIKNLWNRYLLSVHENNIQAIGFYKKNGFYEANRVKDEIQMIKEV